MTGNIQAPHVTEGLPHPAMLIVDEVQKVQGWSETIKRLWDEDSVAAVPLCVLLSGSSPLLVQKGLTESLAGLSKFAGQKVRQRGSSPKFQVLNTALMTALAHTTFSRIHTEREHWGRLVESAVGAHLFNSAVGTGIEIQYWLDRNRNVDFVLVAGESLTAIEVKSGRRETMLPGIAAFAKAFPVKRQLLVGAQGIPLEDFLMHPAAHWLE